MMRISSRLALGLWLLLGAGVVQAQLRLFVCEPEWAGLLTELAPEAQLDVATHAHQDPHYIQARPSLIAKLRQADGLICTGAELEVGWLPALLLKASNRKLSAERQFYAAMAVERLDVPERVDRSQGDVHAAGNPHVHLDPRRLLVIAAALSDWLARLDPAGAADYRQRLADWQARWQGRMADWERRAQPLAGMGLVAYHSSYRYLFDWLGVRQVADLEPKPGLPPTSGHLAQLLTGLKAEPAVAIVHTAYQDPKAARWLAERSGLPVLELAYSLEAEAGIPDLASLFDRILDQLLSLPPVAKLPAGTSGDG